MRTLSVCNEMGRLVLHVCADDEALIEGHLALMKRLKYGIGQGKADSPTFKENSLRTLFRVLFGDFEAERLIVWYNGDCEAAFNAILPYYDKKLMPRLRRLYRRRKRREAGH